MSTEIVSNHSLQVRIDRFLRKNFPDLNQAIIEKALRKGLVKVNGQKVASSHRLSFGDIVYISNRMQLDSASCKQVERSFSRDAIELSRKLLSEYLIYPESKELIDKVDFIAIDKPSGLAVQGGSKIRLSIDDAISYLNYSLGTDYKLVHRLDKNTSGVLLIAVNHESAVKIGALFKHGLIKKTYIAILAACPKPKIGKISNYIGKAKSGKFEIVKEIAKEQGGKLAVTEYRVLEHDSEHTLVEYRPLTGRFHQLRFHSKFLGCPIIGDVKYGGPDADRMFLHALTLTMTNSEGQEICINSKKNLNL